MVRDKFHKFVKSKNISHMDAIIEEFLSFDDVNMQLLFNNQHEQTKQAYTVNNLTTYSVAFNQKNLDQDIVISINKEL